MEESISPHEGTPLLPGQRDNLQVPMDLACENGITFYGCPNPSPNIIPYQADQHLHHSQHHQSFTHRSDSSSLITLAVGKKMSDPRRTFCLFVTFDLLLTILLWLIEIGISCGTTNNYFETLCRQIDKYALHTSLFDVMVLAVIRFLFLQVTYGLLLVRYRWPVACSTAVSDACLIVKTFSIFIIFSKKKQTAQTLHVPMAIVLILADFVLTWIEVWLIDFKVLPTEEKLAHRAVQEFLHNQSTAAHEESMLRRPLIRAGSRSYYGAGSFHSPAATPPASEGGYTGVESMYYSMRGNHSRSTPQLSTLDGRLEEQGKEALNKVWEMYHTEDMWRMEKRLDNGDVVYSAETTDYGKSFKIVANIAGKTPDVIMNEIVLKPEEMPAWNTTVADVKILKRIGDKTCVTLEVSSRAAMGIISSREFITVRRVEKRDDVFVSAGISTDLCEDIVPKSNFVRGINGPTGFIVSLSPLEVTSSTFVWILNTDLKGNLSRSLVNSNLARTMTDFTKAMRIKLMAE